MSYVSTTYITVGNIVRDGIKYPKDVEQAFAEFDKAVKSVEKSKQALDAASAKHDDEVKAQDAARLTAAREGKPDPYDHNAIARTKEAKEFALLTLTEAQKQREVAASRVMSRVRANAQEVIPAAANAYVKATDKMNKAIEGYATEYAAWREKADGLKTLLQAVDQQNQARNVAPETLTLQPPRQVDAAGDQVINSILNPKPVETEPAAKAHRRVNVFF